MKKLASLALFAAALSLARSASAASCPALGAWDAEDKKFFSSKNATEASYTPANPEDFCVTREVVRETRKISKAKGTEKTKLLKDFNVDKVPGSAAEYTTGPENELIWKIYGDVFALDWSTKVA
jgi:hypothetical protein